MNILVCCTNYPNVNGNKAMAFVHTRNLYYVKNGLKVVVLNFSAESSYEFEGIKVISYKDYINCGQEFDVLICHSPNIRNHYKFLKYNGNKFNRIIFFFHGHEVLKISDTYPKEYDYIQKKSIMHSFMQDIYDKCKFYLWSNYFNKNYNKIDLVFVSGWMKKMFFKNIKLDRNLFEKKLHIIYNCVGEKFLTESYDSLNKHKYDFITIRNNIDGAKYCIDIVTDLARNNPEYRFLLIGNGKYFSYNSKPDNLYWMNKQLSHKEMASMLNCAKCAIMLTRLDAQGVSMCEMATYGIPVITSDLDICKEALGEFKNVVFVNNENINLKIALNKVNSLKETEKINKYSEENTIYKEVKLIYGVK